MKIRVSVVAAHLRCLRLSPAVCQRKIVPIPPLGTTVIQIPAGDGGDFQYVLPAHSKRNINVTSFSMSTSE